MITFSRPRVGTAPGTTTLTTRQLGVMQCYPPVQPIQYQQRIVPKAGTQVAYELYPNHAALKGGLGFVLTPWEINRTLPGRAPYLKPFDPQYTTRGERGWYYDTPLGEIPTDAELGPNECYTPVKSGWIAAKEGFIPPPWVPGGWRPVAPQYGPPTSLSGELAGVQELGAAAAQLSDVADELAKHQRRMFYLSIISTAAIVTVATAAIVRAMKGKD